MTKTDTSIIADLRHIAHLHESVDLLNEYQGIPVLYKAELMGVGTNPDHASIRFSGFESVCLALEQRTTLLTDQLAGPVHAAVQALDLSAGTATLSDFHYTRGHIGDRLMLRVAPAAPVGVTLSSGPLRLTGVLADLTMSGAGVLVSPPEQAAELRRHSVIQMNFILDGTALELSGAVRYLRTDGHQCRVGITLVQSPQARTLFDYIHSRQSAALNDLETKYRSALLR